MEKIDVFLKNIAQVVLINSKWTGLFILIGLFVADWELGLAAALGSALSVLLAPYFNYSAEEIHNGLAGYNSVLTAIGLALFLQSTTIAWIVLVISVILTLPVGAATREFLKSYGVPMLTFPFVLMTWLILAMTTQFSKLSVTVDILPLHVKHPVISHHHISWLSGITTNFSEIFLVTSIGGSVLILIGIFLGSIIFAVACIALLGGDYPTIANGLYGYNAVLTGIALGATFMTKLNKYIAVITGLLLTIVMHGALATLLTPVGLPILTAPFIFATWLVLFAGKMSNEN